MTRAAQLNDRITTSPRLAPANRYAWYLVGLLAVANGVSFLDRGFINLVLEPVRKSLGLSDVQMGLVIGPTFILFYSAVSLPLAVLADRYNRKRLIVAGILFWSACAFATGFAHDMTTLALARMGLGLGEAALVPAGVSLISDHFARERIGRAVSTFTAGGIFGGSLASFGGGFLLVWLGGAGALRLAGIGLEPWQAAFILIAVPGPIVALAIALTVREPVRVRRGDAATGLVTTLRYLGGEGRVLLVAMAGFALMSAASGISAWMATFYIRTYGMTPGQVGLILGGISILLGFPGTVLGGHLTDLLRRRGREDASIVVAVGVLTLILLILLVLPHTGSAIWSFVLAVPLAFLLVMMFGVAHPGIVLAAPPQLRSQAVAIYLLLANLIGIGVVPVVIPLLTERLFNDPLALRHALSLTALIFLPCAIAVLLGVRRSFVAHVERLKSLSGASA